MLWGFQIHAIGDRAAEQVHARFSPLGSPVQVLTALEAVENTQPRPLLTHAQVFGRVFLTL